MSDRVAARTESNDSGLQLTIRDVGSSVLHPARAEFALALKLARDVTGVPIVPVQVAFDHHRPDDVSGHLRFFRVPVRFGAGTNTMIVSAVDVARPLAGADAATVAPPALGVSQAQALQETRS